MGDVCFCRPSLGRLLGASWGVSGASWAVWGPSWAPWNDPSAIRGPLAPSCGPFGALMARREARGAFSRGRPYPPRGR
eukprot:6747061-Pyramimonas_sp.AAC.1